MFKRQIQRLLIELLWPRVHFKQLQPCALSVEYQQRNKTRNYESFGQNIPMIKSFCHRSLWTAKKRIKRFQTYRTKCCLQPLAFHPTNRNKNANDRTKEWKNLPADSEQTPTKLKITSTFVRLRLIVSHNSQLTGELFIPTLFVIL